MTPPTKRQKIFIRIMIAVGILSMGFMCYELLQPVNRGYPPLYWALLLTLLILSGKLVHEWYHYFNIAFPPPLPRSKTFTVDVFTTFCPGEPYDMIENTLLAIKNIRYPHETYLCDEANDPRLVEFCKEHGIHHVTRTKKVNAKAGNINNALRHAKGEICLILDPDHVPEPHFLDEIVPYFNDDNIGYVQTVQAYDNIHESLISKGAAQQTFQFYGPMMMCMNSYGTVQAIGANCTFRRKALDSIGGHAAGLAEDMHTAMQLHSKGWKSVYVPKILTRGLVPSTLSAYLKQQLKWSRGVFELLFTTYPKVFGKLTWPQRIHYGILPFFYLISLAFMLNFFIPVIALFTGLMPIKIDLIEFLLLTSPLLVSSLLVRQYVQKWVMEERERGLHIVGGLLLIGTWWIHFTGFVYSLLRKNVPYVPTPKDDKEENNWPLHVPNILILLLSLAAIVYGFIEERGLYYYMMASLAFLNAMFMVFNILAGRQQSYRRVIDNNEKLSKLDWEIRKIRIAIWKFNHGVFRGVRKVALVFVLLAAGMAVYLLREWPAYKYDLVSNPGMRNFIGFHLMATKNKPMDGVDVSEAKRSYSETYDILKPATIIEPEKWTRYQLLQPNGQGWKIVTEEQLKEKVEWYLIRVDENENSGSRLKKLGEGAFADLTIPENWQRYRILISHQGEDGKRYRIEELNTPFPDYGRILE